MRAYNNREKDALCRGMQRMKRHIRRLQRTLSLVVWMTIAVVMAGCGADAALKKGDKFYALGEYYDASNQYKKAYSATAAKERTQRGMIALKMAGLGYKRRDVK